MMGDLQGTPGGLSSRKHALRAVNRPFVIVNAVLLLGFAGMIGANAAFAVRVGDLSASLSYLQGPGQDQQTVRVVNTGSPSQIISDTTIRSKAPGVTIMKATQSEGGSCMIEVNNQVFCGDQIPPGKSNVITITTNKPVTGTPGAQIWLGDSGDNQQGPVTVAGPESPPSPKALVVEKTIVGGDRVSAGHYDQDTAVTFEIKVTNPNAFEVTYVSIRDLAIDNGNQHSHKFLSHVTVPPGCTAGGTDVVVFHCENVILAPHGTHTLRVVMKFNTASIGAAKNLADVSGGKTANGRPVPANDGSVSLSLVHQHSG